jgi:hypothetical protein
MSKQTAVDYLFEKLCGENGYVDTYYMDVVKKIEAIYEEAKSMEREQIEEAYWEGGQDVPIRGKQCEQYYNETYKGGEQ